MAVGFSPVCSLICSMIKSAEVDLDSSFIIILLTFDKLLEHSYYTLFSEIRQDGSTLFSILSCSVIASIFARLFATAIFCFSLSIAICSGERFFFLLLSYIAALSFLTFSQVIQNLTPFIF